MKIEKLILRHLRMPLVAPFETSFGRTSERECLLVILLAEGLIGFGECAVDHDPGYSYETTGTAWIILKDFIAPAILGQEVTDSGDYQKRVSHIKGHPLAKAGIEMALWDLYGKLQGKPLQEMIGGIRKQVEVGVSIGLQESPARLVEKVEEYLRDGYRRIKIKIKPGRDVEDANAVRHAFPEIRLQVDANAAYSYEAAQTLLPLDELGLLLIEQPLAEDDLWDHARLQRIFRTPLCLDESILSLRHARQAIEMGACRIMNIKAGRVGGLSRAISIHDLCHRNSIPVWCGGMLETGIGRASNLALATLPNFSLPGDISATSRYYERDIIHEVFTLNPDSSMDVPSTPGLGVTVDQDILERFTLSKEQLLPV